MEKFKNQKSGFTLIELVVVMAIIAVLSLLIIGAIITARRTMTETTNKSNADTLRTGLESYYARHRSYCEGTGGLTCNTTGTFSDLDLALTNAGISVDLAPTSTTGWGGEYSNLTTAGVTLTPWNWNASDPLPAIEVPSADR